MGWTGSRWRRKIATSVVQHKGTPPPCESWSGPGLYGYFGKRQANLNPESKERQKLWAMNQITLLRLPWSRVATGQKYTEHRHGLNPHSVLFENFFADSSFASSSIAFGVHIPGFCDVCLARFLRRPMSIGPIQTLRWGCLPLNRSAD